jgi:hypothetical protein
MNRAPGHLRGGENPDRCSERTAGAAPVESHGRCDNLNSRHESEGGAHGQKIKENELAAGGRGGDRYRSKAPVDAARRGTGKSRRGTRPQKFQERPRCEYQRFTSRSYSGVPGVKPTSLISISLNISTSLLLNASSSFRFTIKRRFGRRCRSGACLGVLRRVWPRRFRLRRKAFVGS